MGTSFDERNDDDDDDEEPTSFEFNVPVRRNNSSKNLNVENIPLVSK
jgi:hypothetical protein